MQETKSVFSVLDLKALMLTIISRLCKCIHINKTFEIYLWASPKSTWDSSFKTKLIEPWFLKAIANEMRLGARGGHSATEVFGWHQSRKGAKKGPKSVFVFFFPSPRFSTEARKNRFKIQILDPNQGILTQSGNTAMTLNQYCSVMFARPVLLVGT